MPAFKEFKVSFSGCGRFYHCPQIFTACLCERMILPLHCCQALVMEFKCKWHVSLLNGIFRAFMALLSTRPNTPGQGLLIQSGSQNCHWPATDNNEKKKLNVSWVARGCLLDWATVNYSSENSAVGKEKTEVSGYRMWGKDLVTLCLGMLRDTDEY